jgi:hypothetical protein
VKSYRKKDFFSNGKKKKKKKMVAANRPLGGASGGWSQVVLVDLSTSKSFETTPWPSQVPCKLSKKINSFQQQN